MTTNIVPPQVFGVAFSIVGLLPSIAYGAILDRENSWLIQGLCRSVLFNVVPNGGPLSMVWGVS